WFTSRSPKRASLSDRGQKVSSQSGRGSSSEGMIHEYALEPELVATWGNRQDYRYFIEKFGLGQPRIASRYPKKWKRLVFEAFHGTDDVEKKRVEELVQRLAERMVHRREALWNPGRTWSENARAEHGRVPFHAIIA